MLNIGGVGILFQICLERIRDNCLRSPSLPRFFMY